MEQKDPKCEFVCDLFSSNSASFLSLEVTELTELVEFTELVELMELEQLTCRSVPKNSLKTLFS